MMSLAVLLSRARVALGLAVLLAAAPALQAQSTVVRIATTQGNLDLRLLDEAVPRTVVNFIAYLRAGSYKDNMFHRSARSTPAGGVEGPFVIQGGGYRWTQSDLTPVAVTKNNPVANEFSTTRSNLRGTVAMAKIGGNPNSATNEWFVNLSDNTSLDTQNGGFTVFAQVSSDGMGVADRIAALARYNAGGAFNEMPVTMTEIRDFAALRDAAVLITEVIEYPSKATATDADRIFDFLEHHYPQHVPAQGRQSGSADGYTYRLYPQTGAYLGVKDSQVYYLVPSLGGEVKRLGSLTDWLVHALTNGF